MKKIELAFTAVLVPLDFLLVFLAGLTAYSLRFGWLIAYRPAVLEMPLAEYALLDLVFAAIFVMTFALTGLYAAIGARRLKFEMAKLLVASLAGFMAALAVVFFRGELFSSRFIALAAWAFAFLYTAFGRIAVRLVQRYLLRLGIGTHAVVIVGDDASASTLAAEFAANPAMGYRVVASFPGFDEAAEREIELLAKSGKADEIIVSGLDRERLADLLAFAQARHLGFRYSADLLAVRATGLDIGVIADIPIVEVKDTRLEGWGRIFKRIFDILGSLFLIVVTSPVMIAAAVAIKLDSRGPVFFSRLDDGTAATRVGEHGRSFRYLKFRSMRPKSDSLRYTELADRNTRGEGPLVKIKDDPRVTRVGKFIRKYSIDELPELFLVLSGRMSLVGPRPHLPEEVAKYTGRQRRVLTIKPGITGMAQVSGRSDLSFDDEVRLDTYYIENWTPWLDLAILLKTPLVVIFPKGDAAKS